MDEDLMQGVNENHQEGGSEEVLNPWLTMWVKPRNTIRWILENKPNEMVIILAMLGGFSQAMDRASSKSLGDGLPFPLLILAAAVIGAISGIISLYLAGAIFKWTGSWIGGKGSFNDVRTAYAWSNVPIIWALILWIPEIALFGQELFTSVTPQIDANPTLKIALVVFALIESIIGIWAFVIFLKSLGEAHGFSAWKALGTVVLSILVLVVPLVVLAVILGALISNIM